MKNFDLKFAQRLILSVAVAIMVACSWLEPLESTANQQVDAGLKRALASFAIARTLNAGISVLQGMEFSFSIGLGAKIAPAQALRPLNDLVEQFAHLMLVASIAFGVEKILIGIGAHWLISTLLTTAAIGWGYFYLRHHSSPRWLTRIVVVLLMTRFAMPIAIIGSDLMFQKFMADDYTKSQQVIETTIEKLSDVNPIVTEDQSFWKKGTQWYEDIKSRIANLKRVTEQSTERIIKLMVIFLLQTLVLPIFMLWVLWGIAKGIFEVSPEAARFMPPRKLAESHRP